MVSKKMWKEKQKWFRRAVMYFLLSAPDRLVCLLCIIGPYLMYSTFHWNHQPHSALWNPPKKLLFTATLNAGFWMTHEINRWSTTTNNRKEMLAWRRCNSNVLFSLTQSFSFGPLLLRQRRSSSWWRTISHVILTFHPKTLFYLQPLYVATSQIYLRKCEYLSKTTKYVIGWPLIKKIHKKRLPASGLNPTNCSVAVKHKLKGCMESSLKRCFVIRELWAESRKLKRTQNATLKCILVFSWFSSIANRLAYLYIAQFFFLFYWGCSFIDRTLLSRHQRAVPLYNVFYVYNV